ncbi:hypothetical protein TWF481_008353 [Arthrobotrys musiformis]|uniref:Uncharacterized protein n=1 Tax=Arthrobotrys musiformis TaxID=47236 RepID=A0AAV9W7Y0_9PEZI
MDWNPKVPGDIFGRAEAALKTWEHRSPRQPLVRWEWNPSPFSEAENFNRGTRHSHGVPSHLADVASIKPIDYPLFHRQTLTPCNACHRAKN